MLDEPVRLGVVGVGYWGSKHVRVLRGVPGVAHVVAIDSRLESTPSLASGLPQEDRFTSLTDALPHVDAVVIATPPTSHAALALAAIQAGKHVLVEKPLAVNTAEARALVEAGRTHGVTLMVGHTFEYNAVVRALRMLVTSQELGDLFYLDSARLNLGLYQSDVNVVMDLAPHDVSIANYVLGAQPTAVTAWGARHVHALHEDVAHLVLDYEQLGVKVNIHVSWLDPSKVRRTTLVGSKKMAVYDDTAAEGRLRIYDKAVLPDRGPDGTIGSVSYHVGDQVVPHIDFPEPLTKQDEHFVRCIRDGSLPSSGGESGLNVVMVLDAAQISLREGRRVQLDELESSRPAQPAQPETTIDLRDDRDRVALVGAPSRKEGPDACAALDY